MRWFSRYVAAQFEKVNTRFYLVVYKTGLCFEENYKNREVSTRIGQTWFKLGKF